MPVVRMPDGTLTRFPDDMPDDQIKGMIAGKFPDVAAAQGKPLTPVEQAPAQGPWSKYQGQAGGATLNIGGKQVRVSDDFLKLSPEQQNAAVDEIAGQIGVAGPWTKYGGDAKTFQITAPDGKRYKVTGQDEAGAVNALKKMLGNGGGAGPTMQPPGVPQYVPPGVKGYDPMTGEVASDQNTTPMDKLGAFSHSAINGVPIAGPYLSKGVEALSAKIGAATSGQSEEQLRYANEQAANRAIQDNPNTALAGNVTGAVAGTLPAMAAAPELFGGGAAGLGIRSGVSALTGAAINSADAGVRSGGDPYEMVKGGGIGFLTGGLAPGAGALIGKGIGKTVDYFSRPGAEQLGGFTRDALARITKAMEADGLTPEAIQQRLAQLGPDATLADVGPNLQQTAAGLVAKPGEARGIIQNAIGQRDAGANSRIMQALDRNLGPAPVPSQIDAGIRANQRNLSPAYDAAFSDARAVNTQPIADAIDSQVVNLRGDAQSALQRVRSMLNVHGTDTLDPHPGALLQTRQAIDGMLDGATDGNVRRVLTQTRQMVDSELARAAPGIKDADARFAELARQRDALDRGSSVLDSGRGTPRPQELANEVAAGSQPQGSMVGPSAVPLRLREGARAEIDRIVGTNANDRVALQRIVKGEGDWNPQKLATLFGADRAQRILNVLDAEKTFAETSNFVTKNSATAARTEAVKQLDGGATPGLGLLDSYKAGGVLGLSRAAGLKTAGGVIAALRGRGEAAAQSALARGLVSGDQAAVIRALAAVSPTPMPTAALSQVARALMLGAGTTAAGRR